MSAGSAACNDCRTLLGGFVLHALEPEETEAVRRHLAECPACAAEHGQLMGIPSMLDVAGADETPTEKPPDALEEAVLDRFAREHPGRPAAAEPRTPSLRERLRAPLRHLSRPLPAALAGAVAAAAVTAALIVLPGETGGTHGEEYQATLSGSPAAPGATASAELRVFASGTHVRLDVHGLRGTPDTVYELWCLRDDGEKVSAGTFRTDASGSADVNLTTAAVPGEYHRLGVERRTLAPGSKPGIAVMAGEIQYSNG
jgi:anti-sigma-K factor RskA/putative zinc finger protein